jgi:hypothetical protein
MRTSGELPKEMKDKIFAHNHSFEWMQRRWLQEGLRPRHQFKHYDIRVTNWLP